MRLLLVLTLLVSCSSPQKKSTEFSEDIEKEFSHLENSDFKDLPQVGYVETNDKFPNDITDEDVLSGESLTRFPEPKLEDVEEESDVIGKAIANCYKKDYPKANGLLDGNYKSYKNNPSYWNQVGTCFFLKGEHRKALLFYNKAKSLKATFAPALNNIGVIYQLMGNDQKAMLAYDQANKLRPRSSTPLYNKAQILLKYGLFNKAHPIFKALFNKTQKDPDVIFGLAMTYLMQGNAGQSIKTFDELDDKLFERAILGLNLAIAYKMNGNKRKAQGVLEDIDEGEVRHYQAWYNKVRAYVEK